MHVTALSTLYFLLLTQNFTISLNTLLNTKSPLNHCRLLAAEKSHSATWSEAFPIANVGNLLSPDELHTAMTLRTDGKIFESTKLLLHGLSCTKHTSCFPRPDWLTLGPWYKGLSLIWDTTVMDTFAWGHYKDSARQASFTATKGRGCKMPKIPWPPKQLPLSTSCNWDHWCVWQLHHPLFWMATQRTCWYVWWLQGAPVVSPAPVPGCGQWKCCQIIGLFVILI